VGVKLVMLDLDGTLIKDNDQAQPGTREMTASLKEAGLKIAVATNRRGAYQTQQLLKGLGISYDLVEDRAFANNQPKGSPAWITELCTYFKVQTNEIAYLGDTDNDMRTAVNGRVVYFHAGWTGTYPYGISVPRPQLFSLIIRECYMNPTGWYWQLATTDGRGRKVDVKALMDSRGAGISTFKNDMLGFLKDGKNPRVGPMTVGTFIAQHLLGNLYADGLLNVIDTWTVYPSSKPDKSNTVLDYATRQMARLFRDKSVQALVRHTAAVDSGEARRDRKSVGFENQINTVHLNPEAKAAIRGRRIAILDDFMTAGYSMECARNLLFEADALEVTGINFCKYDPWPAIVTPDKDYAWDGYEPTEHSMGSFQTRFKPGRANPDALTALRESYTRVSSFRV
jgi:hypothetical protein